MRVSAPITTQRVWSELRKRSFAVLSYVTPGGEARSAGIVYVVVGDKLYIRVAADSWKARHIRRNPNVALNVTIPKRVLLMPWIQIPQATIAFKGTARLLGVGEVGQAVVDALGYATAHEPEDGVVICFVEVSPRGHFATYGVGVGLLAMRDPTKARGRVPVGCAPAS